MAPSATLRDPGPVEFEAVLQKTSSAACYVDFPHDLKATYGKGNLVPVRAVWDGRVEYRGSLAMMGGERAMLLCRTDVVAALGKGAGDAVRVRVELDTAPRPVEVPEVLQSALAATDGAAAAWERLSVSCRREWADRVAEARRPDTQARRVEQALVGVLAGKRRL